MAEKNETKVKGFRIPVAFHETVEKIIKKSGKDDPEWFIDVINLIQTNELVLDKNEIPADLRKHFGSDVAAIKDATNLIMSVFTNQMSRIAVEKKNWIQVFQDKEKEHNEKEKKLKEQIDLLEERLQHTITELQNAESTITQYQNSIDGFDKLERQLRKDIQRLEEESKQFVLDIRQLKEDFSLEKEKLYNNLDDEKNRHTEERGRLNQQIVDLVEQLKKAEPILDENDSLKRDVKELKELVNKEKQEYKSKLNQVTAEAQLEKEKALLTRERELRNELHTHYREDTKELYKKIELLQLENKDLQLNNKKMK